MTEHRVNYGRLTGKTIAMEKMVAEHIKRHPTVNIVTVRRDGVTVEKYVGTNASEARLLGLRASMVILDPKVAT